MQKNKTKQEIGPKYLFLVFIQKQNYIIFAIATILSNF
jgi:hypothetical protein